MRYCCAMLLVLLLLPAPSARADSALTTAGDVGEVLLPLLTLGYAGYQRDGTGLAQAGAGIGTAAAATWTAKALIHEDRPDGSDDDSFPSGHAGLTFASAAFLHHRYGWRTALPAYAAAGLVAYSRIPANEHYWHDVLAGAALGWACGWFWTDPRQPVKVMPVAGRDRWGVQLSWAW